MAVTRINFVIQTARIVIMLATPPIESINNSIIDQIADISKAKPTSCLTKWLQRLLEFHSKKTKERNVIDYFIYAIYTVLADTKKTRERVIS